MFCFLMGKHFFYDDDDDADDDDEEDVDDATVSLTGRVPFTITTPTATAL